MHAHRKDYALCIMHYARKVNYSCVYSVYILKPDLSGRNL